MLILKTLYSEALVGFPFNYNSIFVIEKERTNKNNEYSSHGWNLEYFMSLLLNGVPRAINLLFITPNYWIYPS